MEGFLVSTGIVALAEIGDKTQLLAFVLAARFRKPLPIIVGILLATLANHALAGAAGAWITGVVPPEALRWILGLSFIAIGAWALIPDKLDRKECHASRLGVLLATLVAFFLVEIGDKTQLATMTLAAQYQSFTGVVAGTTLGMMIANVPAVLFGERLTKCVPIRAIQVWAAVIFISLGTFTVLGGAARVGL